MSAQTLEFLEIIKTKFAEIANNPDREKIPNRYIVQYNVTLGGKVALTLVVNLKDFVLSAKPTANDVEITIADEDVISLFQNKTSLVELKAAVSVSISLNYI